MIKIDLIEKIHESHPQLTTKDVKDAVNLILEMITQAIADDRRVEVRGFGAFTLHTYPAKTGRNPKTGELVQVGVRRSPHFRVGKELKERVNAAK